ncbi:MAG: T9SS type A sorting domain-containing protein [Bacteroidales bacterium]
MTYSSAHELWIEGVGSNRGILESGTAGYVGGWRWFLCMSQNEELIYMNPNYNTCYLKTTSINENIKPIIGVYPNPTTNYLWISIPAEMPLEGLTVEVFNTAGLSMTTTRPASHNFSIETGHLPSGLYFVRINTGEKSFTTKFSVKGM